MVAQTQALVSGVRPPPLFYPRPTALIGTAKLYRLGGVTGGFGLTHCALVPSEAPFTGGFLTIYNNQTTPIRIDAACVAPTQTANDGFSPIQGGAAGTWTVLSGGPWVVPPGRWNYTIPTAPFFLPGFIKIPFTAMSVPRTDITTAPHLLMFRVHAVDQLNAATPTTAQLTAQSNVYNARRPWDAYWKSGNFVASNQSGIGAPTRGLVPALSVDFATTVAAKTVLECGDSTGQGAKSVDSSSNPHDFNGGLMIACDALSTLTRPVYAANCGFQGYTVDQITNAAEVWLNANPAHIVIMQPWSVNDPTTSPTLADAGFLKGRAVLLKAKRSGMTACWRTALPSSSLSLTNDNIRKAINARCKADPDFPCVDYEAAVTDGGSPAKLQSSFDSGDGTHPNNAGYSAIASALQTFLSSYV